MLQAVLLDLDGTLVDSVPDIAAAMNRALSMAGLPEHPVESYRLMVGNGARILTRRAAEGAPEKWEQIYRTYRETYSRVLLCRTRPYPGIPELLEGLRKHGIRRFVLSNKDQADVARVVEGCFPGTVFDRVCGRRDEFPLKPDPASALDLLSSAGIAPEHTCVIGDSAVDIALAKAMGSPSLGCAWGFRGRGELADAGADRICDTALEALSVLTDSMN